MTHTCPECGQTIPESHGFSVDEECDVVLYHNRLFPLTPLISRLFIGLYIRRPRFVPEWALFDDLYGFESEDEQPRRRTLNVYISMLRKKLEGTPLIVENAPGRGWRLIAKDEQKIRWA